MGHDQSNIDKMSRERLEAMLASPDNGGNHIKAKIALGKLDKKDADDVAERRHRETMKGDKVARRWAAAGLVVAVVALFRPEIGILRSETEPSPEETLHSSPSYSLSDHRRDIAREQESSSVVSRQDDATPSRDLPVPAPATTTPEPSPNQK
jgi:dienelactone hydrolase